MGYTSTVLKAAVEDTGQDQQAWAVVLRMHTSQFNKYCNGHARIGEKVLTRLLEELPEKYHALLLRGYVLDRIPAKYSAKVEITIHSGLLEEAPENAFADAPAEHLRLLRFLASKMHHRVVLDMLESFVALLRGRP